VDKYLQTYLTVLKAEKTFAGMHNMHGEKEYKLGTRSQVSIASSYIRKVHSSNRPRNAMYRLVEKPCLVTWKCHISSRGNNIFHGRLWHFTREIPHVATCVEMKL